MAPAPFRCHFSFCECCIVNRKVSLASKRNHLGIALAGKTFGVAKQRESPATVLETIAVGAVRMIEQRRSQGYVVVGPQNIARLEIAKFNLCFENLYWYWKPGRAHELAHDVFDAVRGHQIAGPNTNPIVLAKKRREERQPGNVIEMT